MPGARKLHARALVVIIDGSPQRTRRSVLLLHVSAHEIARIARPRRSVPTQSPESVLTDRRDQTIRAYSPYEAFLASRSLLAYRDADCVGGSGSFSTMFSFSLAGSAPIVSLFVS